MKKITSIALLVILSLATLGVYAQDQVISLKEIYKTWELYPEGVRGIRSMNDGTTYSRLEKDTIFRYAYKTGEKEGIIAVASELRLTEADEPIRLSSYSFSDNEQKLLIPTKKESIYRHSSKSEYYIWDLETKTLTPLSENGKQQLASFSPDGNKIAFVRDNNIFIKDLSSTLEQQITFDGKFNSIINGSTDWVYEEEFAFTKGFFWSPEGNYIAYYKMDESSVKEFQFTTYGNLYPEEYTYKYPKAGEDNSLVDIYVYSLETEKSSKMEVGPETDQYIPRIKWTTNDEQLAIFRMNRLQNKLEIILANVTNGKQRLLYEEENKYYIDINDNLTFLPDGKSWIFTSEKDGYNHIYHYSMDGQELAQLTTGAWEVDQIYGYSVKKKGIYFSAAKTSPINREVYFVSLKGKIQDVATKEGTNSAQFSTTFEYYIHTWSDANHPPIYTLNRGNGKKVRGLEDNASLVEKMKTFQFGDFEFFDFNTEAGVNLNATMLKPLNFDSTANYPLLMWVYGGPGSQTVMNSWQGGQLWYRMMAQKGFVIVSVDNRGTGFRGEEFKKVTYQELGKYEVEDQIGAAKYLGTLPFIDSERMGIFGWSYGGFMSTLCISKGADVFNTAIAVAPVTNWRYYDNIYTERYMRTPQENADGYDNNSPINHVEKIKGNYLLVHGTADDNVHVQNSVDLVTALVNADIDFDMMFYPNSNHGIYTGRNTRYHLYTKMTNFLIDNLKEK